VSMEIEEALVTEFSTRPAITALVGDRIYPQKLPQADVADDAVPPPPFLPALVYRRIDTPRVTTHDQGAGDELVHPRFTL
jgi:hypothetical protein